MKKFIKRNKAKAIAACTAIATMTGTMTASALALGLTEEKVTVNSAANTNPDTLMGNIFGILLAMMRYVGIGLVLYGVFEIVQSFMNNQPEAKSKGIIMALSGVVAIGLKSILVGAGVVDKAATT